MKKKTNQKINKKASAKAKKSKKSLFTIGLVNPNHARILLLLIAIIFTMTLMIVKRFVTEGSGIEPIVTPAPKVIKFSPLEKEISQLVDGYPIERMVPYIASQDPKVAAFLISIAKKESNWGVRRPVLDGKDCYNYWGFRLKSDKMGSGGHTCFDSPKEAVETVASRLDELVNQENIDSPKEMIVWKCGYGCQDKPKNASEQKWIKDVNLYYKQFSNYL